MIPEWAFILFDRLTMTGAESRNLQSLLEIELLATEVPDLMQYEEWREDFLVNGDLPFRFVPTVRELIREGLVPASPTRTQVREAVAAYGCEQVNQETVDRIKAWAAQVVSARRLAPAGSPEKPKA